jgi:hypothetical protein
MANPYVVVDNEHNTIDSKHVKNSLHKEGDALVSSIRIPGRIVKNLYSLQNIFDCFQRVRVSLSDVREYITKSDGYLGKDSLKWRSSTNGITRFQNHSIVVKHSNAELAFVSKALAIEVIKSMIFPKSKAALKMFLDIQEIFKVNESLYYKQNKAKEVESETSVTKPTAVESIEIEPGVSVEIDEALYRSLKEVSRVYGQKTENLINKVLKNFIKERFESLSKSVDNIKECLL